MQTHEKELAKLAVKVDYLLTELAETRVQVLLNTRLLNAILNSSDHKDIVEHENKVMYPEIQKTLVDKLKEKLEHINNL